MSRTAEDLWQEDRRDFLDRTRDRVWWSCLNVVSAAGLLCALASWGWFIPVVIALSFAVGQVVLSLAFRQRSATSLTRDMVDRALLTGVAAVAAMGLLVAAAGWGLLLTLLLTATSPAVHRAFRHSSAVLRMSLATVREMSTGRSTSSDGHDWP